MLLKGALAVIAIGTTCIDHASAASRTQVILLGTGTPAMDPDRSGPATAIVVDDAAYLIDIGPGVVRRAAAAAAKNLSAVRIRRISRLRSSPTYTPITPWVTPI